jgi:hypothetical protein
MAIGAQRRLSLNNIVLEEKGVVLGRWNEF